MIDEGLWAELEEKIPPHPGVVRRRVREESERDLFVGVSHPSRQRLLILSVRAEAAEEVTEAPTTRALRTTLEPGLTPGTVDIRVALTVPEMARVFDPFVDDVVEAVAAARSDRDAVAVFITRFRHWRTLLAGTGPAGLGSSEVQGLFGELWTLRHLILDPLRSRAVEAWTGPEREDRDFQWGNVAVEVKATTGDNPQAVEISSERQLEHAGFRDLFLVVLSIDASAAGAGESLNSMVDDVRSSLPDEARVVFRDSLLRYGYLEAERHLYDIPHFTLRQLNIFRVQEGFPRITESILPTGVGRVRYRLSVPACAPWQIAGEELQSALERAD